MSKAWIDIMTTKQVWFFGTLVEYLQDKGVETYVSVRQYQENTEVLENAKKEGRFDFDYEVTGVHGGQSREGKLREFFKRCEVLMERALEMDMGCALTLSSPEVSRIAYGLGIPHICTSDSPFAVAASKLSFPFSQKIITSFLSKDEDFIKVGADPETIIKYEGIDEVAWTEGFSPNPKVLKDLDLTLDKPIVVVRALSPHFAVNAPNYAEDATGVDELLDALIPRAEGDVQIVAIPRYGGQGPALRKRYGDKITVVDHVEGPSLNSYAAVLVSAGGTMAREASLLGTFAVSMDPLCKHPMAYGEKFLSEKDLMLRTLDSGEAVDKIIEITSDESIQKDNRQKAARLRKELEDPIPVFYREMKQYLEN